MNGPVKFNTDIIFGTVLMLCSKVEQILSTSVADTDQQSWHVFYDTVYIVASGVTD